MLTAQIYSIYTSTECYSMKKNKNVFQIEVVPSAKQQTLQAFFQYFKLSGLFFDRRRDEIYDITDLPEDNEFFKPAMEMAKQLNIDWNNMSHEDSNRIILALLEDAFNLIREIENSKSIVLQTKIIIKNECCSNI